MSHSNNDAATGGERRRVSTGDAGLDRILGGGLFRGAVAILQGVPGAGKTTLANQMAFENSRRGGRTVYMTLLSESHGRMTTALASMHFFDDQEVGSTIHYISAYRVLIDEGPQALLRLLATESQRHEANLIVLDGLFVVADAGLTESEYRKFVNDLALQAELLGCTVLLLTNSTRASDCPEYTMVDAWLEIGRHNIDRRSSAFVQVHKVRGSGFLPGRHVLRISDRGVVASPRIESYLGHRPRIPSGQERLSTGAPALDDMLGGGIPVCSNTLVWGASGTGKSTVGMQFLSACTPHEPGLLFTFYESPDEYLRSARLKGIDLAPLVDEGALHIVWHAPVEHDLDALGHALLDAVHGRGIRRLVVDGVDAFEKVALYPERLNRFLASLTYELRSTGCTSIFISEISELFGDQPFAMAGNRSAIGQNIILLRYVQDGARMRRCLSIIKVRESDFDHGTHEFRITSNGIEIVGPFDPSPRSVASRTSERTEA